MFSLENRLSIKLKKVHLEMRETARMLRCLLRLVDMLESKEIYSASRPYSYIRLRKKAEGAVLARLNSR